MTGGSRSADVARRWSELQQRLESCGGAGVEVVAVTKGHGIDAVEAALTLGMRDLGENYAQELLAKAEAVALSNAVPDAAPRWHFIGRLQRNKVRGLAPHIALWQSVDRVEVGREIAKWAPGAKVLVQVNPTGEPQKGGCLPGEVPALVVSLVDEGLDVVGLMAVGPTGPPASARVPFELVVGIADTLGLRVRSLGMSSDLEVAIEAGSTMVRVGSDLFGPRPARPASPDRITEDHRGVQ